MLFIITTIKIKITVELDFKYLSYINVLHDETWSAIFHSLLVQDLACTPPNDT